jgi:NitT/TauT family transport system substrate-binding protein
VLETETAGRALVEDKDSVTTVLVASARFLRDEPDLARRVAKAHDELTAWLAANPDEAKKRVAAEILAETGRGLAPAAVESAWRRLTFDASIDVGGFSKFVAAAKSAGFLADEADLSRFVDARR